MSSQYIRQPPLDEAGLAPEPMAQLARWLAEATAAGMIEPTAMTLATATADGQPSARIVLYKGPHDGGLTFYTNYDSRPRGSQLGAFTSRQSRIVTSRADLERRLAENEAKFGGQEVPVPANWGGYLLRPAMFEFWQGRRDRLHDRLVYRAEGGGWRVDRLEP